MNQPIRWLLVLAAVAPVAAYLFLVPKAPLAEPFAQAQWEVKSVMLLDSATTTTFNLAPPCRVIRNGEVVLARSEDATPGRVVRVDLTIEGEPVTIYTRIRD